MGRIAIIETECLWFGRLDTKLIQERKSLKMKRDVGMAYKKVHRQGRIKVIVNSLASSTTGGP